MFCVFCRNAEIKLTDKKAGRNHRAYQNRKCKIHDNRNTATSYSVNSTVCCQKNTICVRAQRPKGQQHSSAACQKLSKQKETHPGQPCSAGSRVNTPENHVSSNQKSTVVSHVTQEDSFVFMSTEVVHRLHSVRSPKRSSDLLLLLHDGRAPQSSSVNRQILKEMKGFGADSRETPRCPLLLLLL